MDKHSSRQRRARSDSESSDDEGPSSRSSKRSSRRSRDSSNRSRSRSGKSEKRKSRRSPTPDDSDSSSSSSDDGRHKKRSSSSRKVSEEEIAGYMAKKAQKKAMRVAKKLKTQTVSGYSNDSNPFGDNNLNEKIVWKKKIHRDVSQGLPLDMLSVKAEKQRQRERMAEIEKVKKRREERAIEKAQHEEEMAMLARERARAEFQDWEKKEEEFHFDQSKVRSEIRLREGRTKPIDVLSKHLNGSDDFDIEINEPYMVFKGLTVKEMEELHDDIKMHLDLDRTTPTHVEFWEVYWWHDKYRPRKPKYFNRVHTGYEWNKYNQTHYDHDNPPPKIVQGYKFNIFYPDLVDKSRAPEFKIEKDGSNGETCIIRFHAGPPYEDIAFKIVNKEWEYSHKKGFKCTFERGILHVYFNFKRYRYRR